MDWTGNKNSVFKALAASNHSSTKRQKNDYYATEPKAAELLLEQEKFSPTIWECACGEGHLAEVFKANGYNVIATDLIYRGYGEDPPIDFLKISKENYFDGDIVTNPPYKFAMEFCKKAIQVVKPEHKVAMFLKLQFLEGKARKEFFKKYPPKIVYVSSSRLICAKNGEFDKLKQSGGSAVAYAWFLWEKGYKGETIIKWIN